MALFQKKIQEPTVDPDSVEWLLHDRMKTISERMAELQAVLKPEREVTYEGQELRAELRALEAERAATSQKIKKLNGSDQDDLSPELRRLKSQQREKDRAEVERRVKSIRQNKLQWCQKLEAEGDYRQARLTRLALLDLREQVERDFDFRRTEVVKKVQA